MPKIAQEERFRVGRGGLGARVRDEGGSFRENYRIKHVQTPRMDSIIIFFGAQVSFFMFAASMWFSL